MADKKLTSEAEVMAAVVRLREANGSCTFQALGVALGITKPSARSRVNKMAEKGLLLYNTEHAGSIRLGPKAPRPEYDVTVKIQVNGAGVPVASNLV